MRNPRFGCLTGSGLLAVLTTLLVATGIGLARGGMMFSPGGLNAQPGEQPIGGVLSHAETGGRCSACHPAFWEKDRMADRCVNCHQDLTQNNKDFHVIMLVQGQELTCRRCHPDHRGPQASLIDFSLQRFPHDEIGFSLKAHQEMEDGSPFACSDCHGERFSNLDVETCRSCHSDLDRAYMQVHQEYFGLECLACHDGIDSFGESFDHNLLTFPLEGGHAPLECSACHQDARSLADLQAAPQECRACHAKDDAHNGQLGDQCGDCHTPVDWEQASFDHDQTDFPLEGGHQEAGCGDCHAEKVFASTPQYCAACHAQDDAHQGRFGVECGACHTPINWDEVEFDHSLSAFPLTGAHVDVECLDCHVDEVYGGTPLECQACHAQDDAHQGRFGVECGACHSTNTWEGAEFDHSLAAFPLNGAHANVECLDCHVDEVYAGTPQACAACHADPAFHQGIFAAGCDSCHTTAAWLPAAFDQPHTFPINHGEQGPSDCRVCHPDRLSSYTCYQCHEHDRGEVESKHREEGISNFQDCMRCHPTGREEEGEREREGD